MLKGKRHSQAFTLIELLVVIGIIAVLSALLMTALSGARRRGNMVKAMSNMKQVGTGLALYSNEHNFTLPGRQSDGADNSTPKWPALLAGTDGSGAQNLSTNYVGNVKVYIAPMDPAINPERSDLFVFLTTNNPNNTSWIMNGYDDLGSKDNPGKEVRTLGFTSPADTIIFAQEKSGLGNYYMDFLDGDNNNLLEKKAYNGGSTYLFADGSVRFITEADYNKPAPQGSSSYGDWLWLSDKSQAVPTP